MNPRRWSGALLGLALVFWLPTVFAEETSPSKPIPASAPSFDTQRLLAAARQPALQDSWGILRGHMIHKTYARGAKSIRRPLELRLRMSPERILGQVVFNSTERHTVSQVFADGIHGTSVLTEGATASDGVSLSSMGLRPSDLTLSFLYWDFVGEGPRERISRQPCQVVLLRHPESKEQARVWLSEKHAAPLQVEWTLDGATESYRRLKLKSFKRSNKVWYVRRMEMTHANWKTSVDFRDSTLALNTATSPVPDDLFIRD